MESVPVPGDMVPAESGRLSGALPIVPGPRSPVPGSRALACDFVRARAGSVGSLSGALPIVRSPAGALPEP